MLQPLAITMAGGIAFVVAYCGRWGTVEKTDCVENWLCIVLIVYSTDCV